MTDTVNSPEADREWLVNQIAHALRNPIFAATVQTEALQLRINDPQAARITSEKLHGQLERLSDCIDEMLLFGRPVRCNPEEVPVTEVLNTLGTAYTAGEREEPARINVVDTTEQVTGMWDRKLVLIILERLLDNAVQHTEAPHEITLAAEPKQEGTIVFSVIDRGEGIPPDILEQALLPFFPQHRGRPGLGLAIAEKFARHLGGRIELGATGRGGTTARCILPVRSDG